MISFNNDAKNKEIQQKFLDFWKNEDVYAYVKSQDNRWHFEQNKKLENKSHYANSHNQHQPNQKQDIQQNTKK